jgi:hypothetical protein
VPAAPAHYAGRMHSGQQIRWNASNVPAGSIIGALLLDLGATQPGLQLPTITAPGCMLSTTLGATIFELTLLPPSTVTGAVGLTIPSGYNPGLLGATLVAQYAVLDGVFSGGDIITTSSNALLHTVGLQ